jgi:hypothetical protein
MVVALQPSQSRETRVRVERTLNYLRRELRALEETMRGNFRNKQCMCSILKGLIATEEVNSLPKGSCCTTFIPRLSQFQQQCQESSKIFARCPGKTGRPTQLPHILQIVIESFWLRRVQSGCTCLGHGSIKSSGSPPSKNFPFPCFLYHEQCSSTSIFRLKTQGS